MSTLTMNRVYEKWHSSNLGRDMELLQFGHSGARVLVFPTSCGRFFDWEDRGMIETLSHHIDQGWIQLFCVDSVDFESWWNTEAHPSDRAQRHLTYQQYIIDEVLPYTQSVNDNPYVMTLGASFGAYHAINLALRFPGHINRCIGMSGPYDLNQMAQPYNIFSWIYDYYDGYVNEANPAPYVRHLDNEEHLEKIRNLDIIFAVGQTDPLYDGNKMLSQALWDRNVWHAYREWDGFAHDWPVWKDMVLHYIGGPDSKNN